jgi:prephenate dehydrogenase
MGDSVLGITRPAGAKPGLGLIGVGAFGEFAIPHLKPHFELVPYDPYRQLGVDLEIAAAQEIVLLAVPAGAIAEVATEIAPHLRPGTLVLDVCSIKVKPLAALAALLPDHVAIVGTHPLFGPQSGRNGIRGLRLSLCEVRGGRAPMVARFLRRWLGLEVIVTTPEAHDRQMAYVQGLSHLIGRIVAGMELPPLQQTTSSFEHLMRLVETVRHDSGELFCTIAVENPFVDPVAARFFRAASELQRKLSAPPPGE